MIGKVHIHPRRDIHRLELEHDRPLLGVVDAVAGRIVVPVARLREREIDRRYGGGRIEDAIRRLCRPDVNLGMRGRGEDKAENHRRTIQTLYRPRPHRSAP